MYIFVCFFAPTSCCFSITRFCRVFKNFFFQFFHTSNIVVNGDDNKRDQVSHVAMEG